MHPDQFAAFVDFVTRLGWPTTALLLLSAASLAIAVLVLVRIPAQRRPRHVAHWLFRLVIGAAWWQLSLANAPTHHAREPFADTAVAQWLTSMSQQAAIPGQADFVNRFLLPHFSLVAPVVYGLEVLCGVSLMLGVGVRLFGLIGALQMLCLWLGLYGVPGEAAWGYLLLLVLQLIFAVDVYGRSLGIDALLNAEPAPAPAAAEWRPRSG